MQGVAEPFSHPAPTIHIIFPPNSSTNYSTSTTYNDPSNIKLLQEQIKNKKIEKK